MARKAKTDFNPLPGGKLNNFLNTFPDKVINYRPSKRDYLILLVAGILILSLYKKNWFIAATVNGIPISNFELLSQLNQQHRTQTLNQLIEEKIILGEARKNNAVPTEAEIDQRIKELETQVGGPQAFDSLLSQQGLTRSSLRSRIRIPLAISKLYEKDATVSGEELANFLKQNKDQLKATDSASQEKEATEALKQQKLSQIFTQKFQELKQKAKIQIF